VSGRCSLGHQAVYNFLRRSGNDLFAIHRVKGHPWIDQSCSRHAAKKTVSFNQQRSRPASSSCQRRIDPRRPSAAYHNIRLYFSHA